MRTLNAHAVVAEAATRQKTDAGTARPPLPGPAIRTGGGISVAAFAGPKISRGDG